jgi:mannose-1-phosphate guanylyltransferase
LQLFYLGKVHINMKAFLLSAGYGTRLKPLTNNIPKCLVPICGKPLLAWWMDLFEKHGINEVLINTHYLLHYGYTKTRQDQ